MNLKEELKIYEERRKDYEKKLKEFKDKMKEQEDIEFEKNLKNDLEFLRMFIPAHVVNLEFDSLLRLYKDVTDTEYSPKFILNIVSDRIVQNLISLLKHEKNNFRKFNFKPIHKYFNSYRFSMKSYCSRVEPTFISLISSKFRSELKKEFRTSKNEKIGKGLNCQQNPKFRSIK